MFHQIKLIPKENQALIAASGAVILWSTVAVAFKLGLKGLAPVQLLFAGSAISWVFFALLAAQRRCWWIADGERRLVVSLGLLNPLAYYLFLFEAYARLPAQIAQPLNYTWAIVLAILAVPLLGQQLTRRTATGITVSYGGAVWLVSSHPVTPGIPLDRFGILLALVSTFIWSLYWLLNARSRSDALAVVFWSFTVAVPALGVLCALGPGWPPLTQHTLVYGAWVGLIEMGLAFLLWQRAMRLTVQAARIGQLIFISPFLSFVLIDHVLGEPVGPRSVAALAIIVVGLIITGMPNTANRVVEPRN